MQKEALREAIRIVGSMQALADVLGITKGAISQWDKAQSGRVLDVARATGWKVTPHQLRDDLYPNPTDGLPPEIAAELACGEGDKHRSRAPLRLTHGPEGSTEFAMSAARCRIAGDGETAESAMAGEAQTVADGLA